VTNFSTEYQNILFIYRFFGALKISQIVNQMFSNRLQITKKYKNSLRSKDYFELSV